MHRRVILAVASALLLSCGRLENAPERIDPGFQFSQLATSRVAVWPITSLETDINTRQVIRVEYGNRESFLKAFSMKLSGRLLSASRMPSLDGEALTAALSASDQRPLLDPNALIKTMEAAAPSQTEPRWKRIPALMGVKYAFLCRHLGIERIEQDGAPNVLSASETTVYMGLDFTGEEKMSDEFRRAQENAFMRGPARPHTDGVLRMALMDLETGSLVWEETFRAKARVDRRKGIYEVQEQLAAQVLERIQRR